MHRLITKHSDFLALIIMISLFVIVAFNTLTQTGVQMEEWPNTEFDNGVLSVEEIVNGGVGRDGITPIDAPQFQAVHQAALWLEAQAPVITVLIGEEARAYPLSIMLRHEIANDTLGGEPIAVTYCPLCNSAIVYGRIVEGDVIRLGVSGYLYNSGFIMWDDMTESWWKQFTGEAVMGDMTGTMLTIVPSQVVGFSAFAQRYPDGLVLSGDATRPNQDYSMNPYMGYDTSQSPLFNVNDHDDRLQPMERVLAAKVLDSPVAYSFTALSEVGVVNDSVDGMQLVAMWQPGAASALDGATVENSRDVGMAALFARTLTDGRVLTFYSDAEHRIFDNETESEWNIFGEAIAGELTGTKLMSYSFFSHFWFAWSAAYPETYLYK